MGHACVFAILHWGVFISLGVQHTYLCVCHFALGSIYFPCCSTHMLVCLPFCIGEYLFPLLASQSDAHRIAPHRDPNPSHPIHTQSTYSSKARKTHDVIYF